MKTEYDRILEGFDKQIKREWRAEDGDKYRCVSWWHKILFIEVNNLSVDDWMLIRKGDYYNQRDKKQGIERYRFVFQSIKEYKNFN